MYRNRIITSIIIIFLVSRLNSQESIDTTYFKNAIEMYELKNYKYALNSIDSALSVNPEQPLYYDYKSDILLGLKEFKLAGEILDIAKDKFPNDPYTIKKKGDYYFFIGKPVQAQTEYEYAYEVAETDSVKNDIKIYIASTKSFLGNYEEAKNDLLELYQINNMNLLVIMELGNIEDELDNEEMAEKYYRKSLEIDSTFLPAYMNIGYLLQNQKRYSESFEYYEKGFKIDNSIEYLYYSNQSINLIYLNKPRLALEFVEKSIEVNPYNSYAYRNKGKILIELNRLEEACSSLEEALNLGFTKVFGEEVINLKNKLCKN